MVFSAPDDGVEVLAVALGHLIAGEVCVVQAEDSQRRRSQSLGVITDDR